VRLLGGRTIGQKLTSISILSSVTALVSASIAFLAYDAHSFRESMARRILSEAQIVSFNSVSPLLFNDADAATATLGGLRGEPAVAAAVIFGQQGERPLATYTRDAGSSATTVITAPVGFTAGHLFMSDQLLVSEPIRFEQKTVGTLLIRADLGELRDRQRRYVGIVVAILAGSFLLAIGISRTIEKTISRPILNLAKTARAVSADKDYSVRATSEGPDEIGSLVATFNEMLDQIARQNSDLQEARADLERRVEARTHDLAAANKELEAFSYSVSHDLRAPLRGIDGFSNALLSRYGPQLDEQGRHYLERVRAGTLRMARLIDDMLGLAKVGRRQLIRRQVDLSETAGALATELATRPPIRPVRINVEKGLTIRADPDLLAIVLENLMGNAWKFTAKREDACIEVGKRTDGADAAFYVRDNGAGFDMAYADKLFGAFQRLHSDEDFEGTGIGLATVQRIVNRHGGRIWAEGEVGKGATFYFTLEHKP
jgi:signal transduction histidine kinase